MRHSVALACLLAACAASGQAHAETREVAGETLVLTTTTSAATVIGTDRSLSGHVRVTMDGNAACLSVSGGSDAVIATSGCSDDSGTLRVDIPPDMPMTVTANGDGNLHFGDTQAPLILTVNGGSAVQAGRVGRLVLSLHGSSDVVFGSVQGDASLQMTGSGDVRLGSVTGTLVLKHHGDGDLVVGHIEAPALDIESTGSGNELIGAGHVGTLVVRIQGDGDLAVAAPVHDADITAFGGGDVKLGVVTETVHRASGDGSDIIIGGPAVVSSVIGKVASAMGSGSGNDVVVVHSSNHSGHFLTFVLVVVLAFIVWRLVRRRGGGRPLPMRAAPHPGVVAVTDTLKRVEDRLGRVEGYVTSREFDLQQKFKKL